MYSLVVRCKNVCITVRLHVKLQRHCVSAGYNFGCVYFVVLFFFGFCFLQQCECTCVGEVNERSATFLYICIPYSQYSCQLHYCPMHFVVIVAIVLGIMAVVAVAVAAVFYSFVGITT